MKKFIASLIIILCLVWGCATLNPQNVRLVVDSTYAAHSIAMAAAVYLYNEDRLSKRDIRRITELDEKYHELNDIVRDAISAWEVALTISEKEGAEKKLLLNKVMMEFTKVAFELNDFIQELKSRKPGEVVEEEDV